MKRIFACMTVLLAMIANPAVALDLDTAKAKGLVGERQDGYIGAVASNPSPDVLQLVNSINAARKAEYAKIAQRNSQSVAVVEKLAASKLINRVGNGEYYMDNSGNWKKK